MSTDNPSATDSPTVGSPTVSSSKEDSPREDSPQEGAPKEGAPKEGSSKEFSQEVDAKFIYVICQNGGEAGTKLELVSNHPDLKLAFSRPGFVTFKAPPGALAERFSLRSTLARTYGWSLGKVTGENADELVEQIAKVPQLSQSKHLHIWQRDPVIPGRNGFEPGVTALAQEVGSLFKALQSKATQTESSNSQTQLMINRVAKPCLLYTSDAADDRCSRLPRTRKMLTPNVERTMP